MSSLRIKRDGHVLHVAIAKPERRNAFDAELIRQANAWLPEFRVARTASQHNFSYAKSNSGYFSGAAYTDYP
jgi:outer membrane biosynthesis protein TonB